MVFYQNKLINYEPKKNNIMLFCVLLCQYYIFWFLDNEKRNATSATIARSNNIKIYVLISTSIAYQCCR